MMRQAPMYVVVLLSLALGFGVTGDLVGCTRISLPSFWIPIFTGCHYIAILLASFGFGLEIGLGVAILVSVAHVTTGLTACGESILQQGEVGAFIAFALLSGFLVKQRRTGGAGFPAHARIADGDPPARGEISPSPDTRGPDQVSLGFVRAARAPLSAIESAGYVLEDSALTEANHREVAGIILEECHRLDALIRLLEFGQARSPTYQEVELSSILDQVARYGEPLTEAACLTLRTGEDADLRVVCDSELLEQAVLNLLANAIRIAQHGDEIMLSARADKNTAMIEISNRRMGVLGQLGLTMGTMPEALRLNPAGMEPCLRQDGGNQ